MPDTADARGVNPFDPFDAIRGSAQLLAEYTSAYGKSHDPFAMALAAYNAGPGAVAAYRGIPPYPETRQYVADIYERWARILLDEAE
jgi:soluble lytic murein transglycosylase-like protein